MVEDSTARSLINASGLHTNETVLNEVSKTDTVLTAELVKSRNHFNAVECLAVELSWDTLLKVDSDVSRLVRSVDWRNAHFEEALLLILWLVSRIFEVKTFVREVPDVLILGVVSLTAYLEWDVVSLSVVDLLVTGLDIPFSPRSDDSHIRSESLYSKLETNLVIALTSTAVADSVSAFFESYLSDALSNDRTSERSTEHISVLVDSTSLNSRINVVLNEFFLQVSDDELGSASLNSLLLKAVKLSTLSNVTGNSDYFWIVVVFLEPRNDDRCVKTA